MPTAPPRAAFGPSEYSRATSANDDARGQSPADLAQLALDPLAGRLVGLGHHEDVRQLDRGGTSRELFAVLLVELADLVVTHLDLGTDVDVEDPAGVHAVAHELPVAGLEVLVGQTRSPQLLLERLARSEARLDVAHGLPYAGLELLLAHHEPVTLGLGHHELDLDQAVEHPLADRARVVGRLLAHRLQLEQIALDLALEITEQDRLLVDDRDDAVDQLRRPAGRRRDLLAEAGPDSSRRIAKDSTSEWVMVYRPKFTGTPCGSSSSTGA